MNLQNESYYTQQLVNSLYQSVNVLARSHISHGELVRQGFVALSSGIIIGVVLSISFMAVFLNWS